MKGEIRGIVKKRFTDPLAAQLGGKLTAGKKPEGEGGEVGGTGKRHRRLRPTCESL